MKRPTWPLPEPDCEFIRQFGVVRERRKGGIHSFSGEDYYCDAKNAIKLENKFGVIEENGQFPIRHNLLFRRFFLAGGSVAKLELGFKVLKAKSGKRALPLRESDWLKRIKSIAEANCIVAHKSPVSNISLPLSKGGLELSKLYLKSSSEKAAIKENLLPWWVDCGEPIILFEYHKTDNYCWPNDCVKVLTNIKGIKLGYQRFNLSGKKLNIWYLETENYKVKKSNALRNLRLHILRVHAEIQSLKRVLRLLSNKKIEVIRDNEASLELQQYLQDTTRLISKKSRYGIEQKEILETTLNAFDLVTAGERISLLKVLSGIKRNIFLKLERITENSISSVSNIIVSGDYNFFDTCEIKKEGDKVTKFDIKIGDNANIQGDLVIAQSIKDSFKSINESNATDGIKELLEGLVKEVNVLSQKMPESKAKQMADDLKVFSKEVTSEEPRKQWYEMSAKGVIEAAKSLGSISNSAVGTIKKVLELISQ